MIYIYVSLLQSSKLENQIIVFQPAHRRYNAPMAGNPHNPAISPYAHFQEVLTEETGTGGGGTERCQ